MGIERNFTFYWPLLLSWFHECLKVLCLRPVDWSCKIEYTDSIFAERYDFPQWVSCEPVGWSCRIHWPHLCRTVWLPQWVSCEIVGWRCRIHWLHLCRRVWLPQWVSCEPVGWSCRIHWLHLCRRAWLPQRVYCRPVGWGCKIHWLCIQWGFDQHSPIDCARYSPSFKSLL